MNTTTSIDLNYVYRMHTKILSDKFHENVDHPIQEYASTLIRYNKVLQQEVILNEILFILAIEVVTN